MAHTDRGDRRGHGERDLSRRRERSAQPRGTELDEEQRTRVDELRGELHPLAESLRATSNRAEQRALLGPVQAASEPVALAFAQLLGTIRGSEAHDAIEIAQ